jgi:nitrogen regulatory protein P-II 1
MKLIVAIIPTEALDAAQRALAPLGAQVMSVSQVIGGGRDPGYTEIYRGRTVQVRRPQLRLEVAADETAAESVVQSLLRSGSIGDGEVFVLQLAGCVRSRNDHGPVAACH